MSIIRRRVDDIITLTSFGEIIVSHFDTLINGDGTLQGISGILVRQW